MLTSPINGCFNLPLSKTYWYKKISKKLNFMKHMFIAGIYLLSPGEICMMAHHSFATIMFQKKKKKKKKEEKQLSKMYCQNTCNEIAINVNSHFSHYKPMETLSCHSRKSTWAMTIKIIFVEATVMNIAAKFQLCPPYSFWGDDF